MGGGAVMAEGGGRGLAWPLLLEVAWKNVRLRYKSSLLGFLWTLLNPVLYLLIFLFIFSRAFPQVENYPVFALSGLILWTFFATTTAHIQGALVENAGVLRSLAVPPLVFPLAQWMAGLFNLSLSLLPFAGILAFFGWRPSPVDVLAIPALLVFTVFVFGVGLALGALHVFFRDIGLLWGALLPAFFYLTPIAYPPDLVPEDLRWIAGINPLYWYVDLFRTVVSERLVPGVEQWVRVVLLSLVSLTAGMLVFRSLRPGFIANY
ncbi:MAG: ABC transporter permease [Flavobacteriales bacterium]|nr:ABC transporter permease [Flavobacteriales bacterium]